MLPADERSELRALQRKAYGPTGGGLTPAEHRRLRELEDARRTPVGSDGPPVGDSTTAASEPTEPMITRVPDAPPARQIAAVSADADRASDAPEAPRAPLRRGPSRLAVAAVGAAVLVGIGVGAGWALFADHSAEPALTTAQEQRRAELAVDGSFDEGSLRPIARDDDALAWFATQESGDRVCLILDVGAASAQQCEKRDLESARGPWTSLLVQADDDDPGAGAGADDTVSVNAIMLFATDGEPTVAIERWSRGTAMVSQFPTGDRERASELLDQGFSAGLSVVGSFRERPVWLGIRFGEGEEVAEHCLIVDAAGGQAQCRSDFDQYPLVTVVRLPDEPAVLWTLEATNTPSQVPYLTITGAAGPPRSGDDSVEVGGQHGDPIEVRFPTDSAG